MCEAVRFLSFVFQNLFAKGGNATDSWVFIAYIIRSCSDRMICLGGCLQRPMMLCGDRQRLDSGGWAFLLGDGER